MMRRSAARYFAAAGAGGSQVGSPGTVGGSAGAADGTDYRFEYFNVGTGNREKHISGFGNKSYLPGEPGPRWATEGNRGNAFWGSGGVHQYRPPRLPNFSIGRGSGIYPHVNKFYPYSLPQQSPPGEFIPREIVVQQFVKEETCFEYYRRLYALGWTTRPIGLAERMTQNFNTKSVILFFCMMGAMCLLTQYIYINGINYPKTFTNDWAEAEVLSPLLQRSFLQRTDYVSMALLVHFDVRWPRWAKIDD